MRQQQMMDEQKKIYEQIQRQQKQERKQAKTRSNKIDAAVWSDSHCYHYKLFTFDGNSIKWPKDKWGDILGKRVLNTYYELTVRKDDSVDDGFWLGIADATYKNKKYIEQG